ncbi:MAG: GNAT family N-acetyltransferase [Alphaproteobacteria bacterium]|nr:GNAT family N-acetyltransferase [Alphaproteobacteria bacterium]
MRAEAAYQRAGLPCIFRLTSLAAAEGLDEILSLRGYRKLDKTSVRIMTLGSAPHLHDDTVEIAEAPSAEWLASYALWQGQDASRRAAHGAILAAIPHRAAFAAARAAAHPGAPYVALGIAVLQGDWACLMDVITAPDMRRRGLSRRLTLALIAHAQAAGAGGVYLQVVKSNQPALALYNAIGFDREIYRYSYRVRGQ